LELNQEILSDIILHMKYARYLPELSRRESWPEPFEDISKEEFEILERRLKAIDLTMVIEVDDETDHKTEAACAGGACVII